MNQTGKNVYIVKYCYLHAKKRAALFETVKFSSGTAVIAHWCLRMLYCLLSEMATPAANMVRDKLKKGILKTRGKKDQKSSAWNRFYEVVNQDESNAGYVICKSCEAVYVHDSHRTGTSNMVHHICAKPQTSTNTLTSFVCHDPRKVPQDVKSRLTDACVDLCTIDMCPFDIVSGKGFQQVAQMLIDSGAKCGVVDAGAILPHRQTVCDQAKLQASTAKQTLSEDIQKAISSNGGISVTTDMWTDEFKKRAYTVLTCHYISEWKLENRVLATVEFDPTLKKNSKNLHEQITSVLTSYGIQPAKVVFVSDQGPNIKAALRSYHWIPCSAHNLNTVLRHTFSTKGDSEGNEDGVDMIDYCKELVAYLKRTGAVTSLKHTVNQECDVRWNSKVTMLESIQKQYQDIRELLESRDQEHRLDGIHQDQLSRLIEFLTLFKLAISELEGEHYPTIHMVLLWFFKVKKHCEPKFGEPPYMKTLRSRASALLDEKMYPTATHKIARNLSR